MALYRNMARYPPTVYMAIAVLDRQSAALHCGTPAAARTKAASVIELPASCSAKYF